MARKNIPAPQKNDFYVQNNQLPNLYPIQDIPLESVNEIEDENILDNHKEVFGVFASRLPKKRLFQNKNKDSAYPELEDSNPPHKPPQPQ